MEPDPQSNKKAAELMLVGLWRLLNRIWPAASSPPTSLAGDLSSARIPLYDWLPNVLSDPRLYGHINDATIQRLHAIAPAEVAATIAAADGILRHEFNLLGSGPYRPIDPDREPRNDGYAPIDWYLDPVSKLRFPQGIPHQQWDLYAMRPGQADIKYPWELARCQHWATLGQAYRLTGEDAYALEIVNQLKDFMQANPVGMGINWTCTMDVAIRALNWALALQWIHDCRAVSSQIWREAYAALYDHGGFISNNLENNYEVTSNHFLSNIVGLYYLAHVFRELPHAVRWNQFCRDALEEEIEKQVLEDGADYESSVPYHRLVTEMFLGAAHLANVVQQPFSTRFYDRLRKMVQFSVALMRPDGLMPQVGDADDGRLHIFTRYTDWNPQDARHLLAPASLLLNESDWLQHVGAQGVWEAAWWGFDIEEIASRVAAPKLKVTESSADLFPDAGLAVAREQDTYLLISNGIVGTKGFGNHKHNDQLGFEYHCHGNALFVDPGSFVYTSDVEARNLFRSTSYHNTLCVDATEQNEMNPQWIFRLFESAHAEHLGFSVTDDRVEYRGKHIGYERLDAKVTHERRFRLLKSSGALVILDRIQGTGQHQLRWHFHCAPDVSVVKADRNIYRLTVRQMTYWLRTPEGLGGTIGDGWYSPSYGVRVPCKVIDLQLATELKGTCEWLFTVASGSGNAQSCSTEELLAQQRGIAA